MTNVKFLYGRDREISSLDDGFLLFTDEGNFYKQNDNEALTSFASITRFNTFDELISSNPQDVNKLYIVNNTEFYCYSNGDYLPIFSKKDLGMIKLNEEDELDYLISKIDNQTIKVENGKLISNSSIKVWTGQTTVGKDGIWSLDYSDANFKEVLSVIPIPIANNTTSAETPVSAMLTGYDLNSVTGKSHKGLSAGLLAVTTLVWANEGTTINVTVIGY